MIAKTNNLRNQKMSYVIRHEINPNHAAMPQPWRKKFEIRILAGEDVKGIEIANARGTLPNGRPRRPADQPATRMAA
jgi:hypothetical protein